MKLSDQAMGAVMMALQKCLMEQSDITVMLKDFNFQVNTNEELTVENPPVVEAPPPEEKNFTIGSD
jgi:hypothetical protein